MSKNRLGNGVGSVYRLSGKRKNPWAARKTVGYKENGQAKYKYIGYYRTKADAMCALMDYNKAPYSLNRESFEYVYDRFITNYKEHHSPKSVGNLDIAWRHIEPLHDKSIATLSRRELQEFFDDLQVTEQVKQKCRSVLRQLYDYAVRYDIIQPERVAILNYLDLSSNIEVRKLSRDRFSDEEISRIISLDDSMSHIVLFLIYTGLRAGEFCNLTEEDIDENMVMHVRRSKTQAGIREVPLSDKALKLMPLPHFDSYDHMKYYYNEWRKKNGFDSNRTLHCTRYTTISLLVSAGVDDRIIKAIVGHKGTDVTSKVYTKITNEDKRKALNKI
jgi:integrase